MPHGQLTPLARQLRQVLATFTHTTHRGHGNTSNAINHASPDRLARLPASRTTAHISHFHRSALNSASPATAAAYRPIPSTEESAGTGGDPAQDGNGFSRGVDGVVHHNEGPAYQNGIISSSNTIESRQALLESTRHSIPQRSPSRHPNRTRISSKRSERDALPLGAQEAIYPTIHVGRQFRPHSRNRTHRQKRVDHLTEALKDAGLKRTLPAYSKKRQHRDLSYINTKSRTWVQERAETRRKNARNPVYPPSTSREFSLQRILASLIRQKSRASKNLEAESNSPFELSVKEKRFLRFKGVTLDDIHAWAEIASTENALDAARLLAARAEALGPTSVPTFVYLHILRRTYISAKALRILLLSFSNLFHQLARVGGDQQPIMIAVVRLLRHAREVWPQAMGSIVQMLLRHYHHQRDTRPDMKEEVLATTTYFLNRVMALVSYCTAVQPFKDIPHQEAAIVSILEFMAQHDPPLHINRIGYRAVVRIQLAERKTESEQEWARLKKLSWPPWKEDRTAMDEAMTHEDHGISKAAGTLQRMRSAGYATKNWERTALLYAGWDVDHTPTIQMRALLGSSLPVQQKAGDFHPWVARIESTRTVQEAWACYLSWEDAMLPHDRDVFYAIMTKLYKEAERVHGESRQEERPTEAKSWPLLPGDSREISPLPPSTHLYTYTRTPPPSLEEFFLALADRGFVFEDRSVALLFRAFRKGCIKIRGNLAKLVQHSKHPAMINLLELGNQGIENDLPLSVLVGLLDFLAGNPGAIFAIQDIRRKKHKRRVPPPVPARAYAENNSEHADFALNGASSSMTIAIDILSRVRPTFRPAWNAVLDGLMGVPFNLPAAKRLISRPDNTLRGHLTKTTQEHLGSIDAYALSRLVLDMMKDQAVDLDIVGFQKLCFVTEINAIGAWAVLEATSQNQEDGRLLVRDPLLEMHRIAERLTADQAESVRLLKREFDLLVGEDDEWHRLRSHATEQTDVAVIPPALLAVPNPAILHAYVRALGWSGDHDGLLATVRWMKENRQELTERQNQDRGGRGKMRLVMTALRVFLERSWLSSDEKGVDSIDEAEQSDDPRIRARARTKRLRAPAKDEVITAAREIIESVEEWEGWAGDVEVGWYVQDHRFEKWRGEAKQAGLESNGQYRPLSG